MPITRADLYKYGLPRGFLSNPGRLVASAVASTDTFELDDHGFSLNDPLLFRAEEGGALPTGISAGTTYYAIPLGSTTFKVSATVGGGALNFTTDGASVVVSKSDDAEVDAAIAWAKDLVYEHLPAHVVPVGEPLPTTLVAVICDLAIQRLLNGRGQASVSLSAAIAYAQKQLERYAKGIPMRGTVNPTASNLAVARTVGGITTARGWDTADGRIP